MKTNVKPSAMSGSRIIAVLLCLAPLSAVAQYQTYGSTGGYGGPQPVHVPQMVCTQTVNGYGQVITTCVTR